MHEKLPAPRSGENADWGREDIRIEGLPLGICDLTRTFEELYLSP